MNHRDTEDAEFGQVEGEGTGTNQCGTAGAAGGQTAAVGTGMNHRDTEGTEFAQVEGLLAGLTSRIIGAGIEVHQVLGPGLLESAYEACLAWELVERGMRVGRQVPVPVRYKGVSLDCAYRLDLLVDESVVVEVKTVRTFEAIHTAQLLSYLRLTGHRVGLLLNFHAPTLKEGIKRVSL